MDVTVIGVDGGNSKTELVVASTEGELLARVRGPGSNSHGPGGVEACVDVVEALVAEAGFARAHVGVFFLCGADVPADVKALEKELRRRRLVSRALVDNDTFALLRAGTECPDAVAVVCGAGINCVGRDRNGRVARYPALGWETGDWGGSEALGRAALFDAARAEDGRSEATALVELVRGHFALPTVEAVGEAVHYRRIAPQRLGELAPAIVEAAAHDRAARSLVERLASEVALFVGRVFDDLELTEADVVLGGGMLEHGRGVLHDEVLRRLPAGARPVILREPPVLGAGLAALDVAEASDDAKDRLRRELGRGATVRRFADAHELGAALAEQILERYRASEGPFLLGCPGGRSLVSTYRALAERRAVLDRLVVVMMDEYVGAAADAHYSCRAFAERELAAPLRLRAKQIWFPDESDPAAYDERIERAGGVDLFLLASGASDGHVAFVPPGSPRAGRTAVLALAESTRRDNLGTFPRFASVDEVPTHGVSVGLATISAARALRLVLHGPDKRHAADRLLALRGFDPEWPASIVHEHPDAEIWIAP